MRKTLLTAAALGPLLLALNAPRARAETTISSSSTAQATSTVASGGPDDLTIGSGATLSPTSGAAVTLDSDNTVTNNGSITMSNSADGSTGILANAGRSGSVINTGGISVTDDYTATDSVNGDGILEAPFASGTSRYGIRALGALNGSITHSGTIAVEGDNSYGLSLEGPLSGNLVSTGAISLTGANGAAIRIAGPVAGVVMTSNTVSATGQNSVGVDVSGDVGGRLSVYSTVTSTGYAATTRPTTATALNKVQATATDVEQGGSAVRITGNIGGGLFIAAPPAGTASGSTDDVDGDGVADGVEGTGVLTTYGSAPALQIGGASPIAIGVNGGGDNAYGLIVRGTVAAYGVYDGVSATAIDIGAGGGGVAVAGGARIVGSVTASSYQADATGIALHSGAALPSLRIEGKVSATSISAVANTTTGVLIDAGAQMASLVNYGTLNAGVTGNLGSATAVKDASGTIGFVENTGAITATVTPAIAGEATAGRAIALDLSANTAGVFLHQELNGTVAPSIVGDILLGSGPNTVQLLSGSVAGALDLGSAPGTSLLIAGGATYLGALTYSGSGLSVNVQSGTLTTTSASVLRGTDLTVGSAGVLVVALDPAKGTSTQFNLSGAATLQSGAKLGVRLLSNLGGATTYTVIKAGSLSVADLATLTIATPYLFNAAASVDAASNSLNITASRRTAAEMGMNASETSALPAVYAALSQDSGVQGAVLSATDRGAFIGLYDRLLPDHSGDVFAVVSQVTDAASRAAVEHRRTSGGYWDSGFNAWLEEVLIGVQQSKGAGEAYRAAGGGLVGGVEATGSGQALGLSVALSTTNVDQTVRPSASNLSVGTAQAALYWRGDLGGLAADARVGGGYVSMKNDRTFNATVDSAAVAREAKGVWSGYDLDARFGLSYEARIGRVSLTPRVHVDALRLTEHGYAESGAGNGFDLIVQDREAHSTSATASLTAGADFGSAFSWRPQIELGWRDVMDGDAGATTARFAYGGDSFTLTPNSIKGGAAIARVALTGVGDFVNFAVEATGEAGKDYSSGQLRANFRVPF